MFKLTKEGMGDPPKTASVLDLYKYNLQHKMLYRSPCMQPHAIVGHITLQVEVFALDRVISILW